MHEPPVFVFSIRWMARVLLSAGVLIGAAWALAGPITIALASPVVSRVDKLAAAWLHAHAGPVAMSGFLVLTEMHGTAGVLSLAAVSVACMWRTRWQPAWPLLLASVPGGLLLNAAVKEVVQRARPDWGYAYEAIASYSFPSGHTAGASVFHGFILLLLWPSLRSSAARAALLVGLGAVVALVACSRIALGVHYLSDCIAAVCEAAAWLAVCWTGVRKLPGEATR